MGSWSRIAVVRLVMVHQRYLGLLKVYQQLSKKKQPLAKLVHCSSHCLNLVLHLRVKMMLAANSCMIWLHFVSFLQTRQSGNSILRYWLIIIKMGYTSQIQTRNILSCWQKRVVFRYKKHTEIAICFTDSLLQHLSRYIVKVFIKSFTWS